MVIVEFLSCFMSILLFLLEYFPKNEEIKLIFKYDFLTQVSQQTAAQLSIQYTSLGLQQCACADMGAILIYL